MPSASEARDDRTPNSVGRPAGAVYLNDEARRRRTAWERWLASSELGDRDDQILVDARIWPAFAAESAGPTS